ncbi:hypothetical protein YOLOSWAG_44 [Erwinia phage vB_EamM_Yoloswag]|uniref:Uncharacterized protein n=1 Tax=Erwinia phage vB_EamM_Yoloswag TaxID=1958956 RepID=A0A1S6L2Z2_9CAUD|nr:hypothetical protein HOR66_gp044 [Erwinia phage vB_EamM_Yoloswag]AQT28529.1 hypothetical protein YOLOSWAG_44 [Erwinia phage vB_EamM_Yoloswag]
MSNSFLFRLRAKDTPIGVSEDTLNRLCEAMNMNKTEVMHLALLRMAVEWGVREEPPYYEADDGPLTEQQLARIQQLANEDSIRRTGKPLPADDDPRWVRLF